MSDKWYKHIDFPEHEENINIDTDYTLIGKFQSEINDKKDLIIRHWIEFNKDEFKPYISEEVYSFEDIVNRLRKLKMIEQYQLEINEINRLIFALSNLQDVIEQSGGITPKLKMMHQKIERKLKKQKEKLKDEKNIY